jgi:hypothetical protein
MYSHVRYPQLDCAITLKYTPLLPHYKATLADMLSNSMGSLEKLEAVQMINKYHAFYAN